MADDGQQPEKPISAVELVLGVGVRTLDAAEHKLRNCPFCGSAPSIYRYPPIGRGVWVEKNDGSGESFFLAPHPAETVIRCSKCEIRFSDVETFDVVELWNGDRAKSAHPMRRC